MMSILNKINDITIDDTTKQELEHLEIGMNQKDYEYVMSIQKKYDIMFDLLEEYFNKIEQAIISIDGEERANQIFEACKNNKFSEFSTSTASHLSDYSMVESEFKHMNYYMINRIVVYFLTKYNKEITTNKTASSLTWGCEKYYKPHEKIDYKVALKYLQNQYGFIPPQKEN